MLIVTAGCITSHYITCCLESYCTNIHTAESYLTVVGSTWMKKCQDDNTVISLSKVRLSYIFTDQVTFVLNIASADMSWGMQILTF